jgi:hypothetical protein
MPYVMQETIEESGKKIDIEYEEKVTLWMIWKRMQWMDIVKVTQTLAEYMHQHPKQKGLV